MMKHRNLWLHPWLIAIAGSLACSAGGGGNTTGGPGSGGSDGAGGSSGNGGSNPVPDGGSTCIPGNWACYGNDKYLCGADGNSREQQTPCPQVCASGLGCVDCRPGERSCKGTVSSVCRDDGMGWNSVRDCAEWGSSCLSNGFCDDACAAAESTASYVGCEYWPTPLANTTGLDSTRFDYRVVAGNPNALPANVTVTRGASTVWEGQVPAGGLTEIALPWVTGQSFGLGNGAWKSVITDDGAYRLRSDRPITVAQFNPFEYYGGKGSEGSNIYSYTNDAALLLPTHVLTGDYVGVTYAPFSTKEWGTGAQAAAGTNYSKMADYIAIVGVAPEPTNVRVMVTGITAEEKTNRVGQAGPGGVVEFTLQQGEVAHVAAAPPPNCEEGRPGWARVFESCAPLPIGCRYRFGCYEYEFDLTGSRVIADRPVEVFGGHVCAYVPHMAQACDHMEVQIPPIQTWGNEYVSKPMVDGNVAGDNFVRIVAAFDGTQITVDPPQDNISTLVLDANQWLEFKASSAFHVSGSNSFMVAQYLLGQDYSDPPADRGDPGMTVLVPSEQYREDYVFVAPTSYNESTSGQNYLIITKLPGTELLMNGSAVSSAWQSAGGWELTTIPIAGGTHTITGSSPFGVMVYGLGITTSYVYPAGLNLEEITEIIR